MNVSFIFSLPRSGSTLLQRILAAHGSISTTAEPWILLPLVYATKGNGMFAEFGHSTSVKALNDFIDGLPEGRESFDEEIRNFALSLYSKSSDGDAELFIDKTPRYHVISTEIMDIFPQSKNIVLWRHPLSVAASICNTWGGGKWNLYQFHFDLFNGLLSLSDTVEKHPNRLLAIRYEDLTQFPDETITKVLKHLELDNDDGLTKRFGEVSFKGRMGDGGGGKSQITPASDNWKNSFQNPLRKAWARKYLKTIGKERLSLMGYDLDQISKELDDTPFSARYMFSDALRMSFGFIYLALAPVRMRKALKKVTVAVPFLKRFTGQPR